MKTQTTSQRIRRVTLWGCALIAVLVLTAFVLISLRIGEDVRAASRIARAQHEGDPVEALLRYVEDDHHSFPERNRAVWALGQIGDRRALPLLRKHYSNKPCDHEGALCQRELGNAIKLLDGGLNATAIVWRHPADR